MAQASVLHEHVTPPLAWVKLARGYALARTGLPTICQAGYRRFGGFAPATPGFIALGRLAPVLGGYHPPSLSPHSRQRSGSIPGLPYPLHECGKYN